MSRRHRFGGTSAVGQSRGLFSEWNPRKPMPAGWYTSKYQEPGEVVIKVPADPEKLKALQRQKEEYMKRGRKPGKPAKYYVGYEGAFYRIIGPQVRSKSNLTFPVECRSCGEKMDRKPNMFGVIHNTCPNRVTKAGRKAKKNTDPVIELPKMEVKKFVVATRNPATDEFEDAFWANNVFGPKVFGVTFQDGSLYSTAEISLEAKGEAIDDRLTWKNYPETVTYVPIPTTRKLPAEPKVEAEIAPSEPSKPKTETFLYTRPIEVTGALAILRGRAGVTQTEIAEKTDTTQRMIRKYEQGRVRLPIEKALAMAELYKVSVEEVVKAAVEVRKEHMDGGT